MADQKTENHANSAVMQDVQAYQKYLNEHKVQKGEPYTHTLFGKPYGSFRFEDDELDTLYNLYSKVINKVDHHLTERPKEVGPLLIDFDFNMESDVKTRMYTQENIQAIIIKMNTILKKYVNKITKAHLKSFVFEKPKITEYNDRTKDGFHIVYPNIALNKNTRYVVIDDLLQSLKNDEDVLENIPYTNELEDVLDNTVVWNNGWMVYGSRKEGGQFYRLTKIYKYNMEEEDIKSYTNTELVKLLSNRRYDEEDQIELKASVDKALLNRRATQLIEKREGNKKKNTPNNKPPVIDEDSDYDDDDDIGNTEADDNSDDSVSNYQVEKMNIHKKKKKASVESDVELAKKIIVIISKKRAENWSDWTRIGWALHNIDSEALYDTFLQFSNVPKYRTEYKKACEKLWRNAKKDGNLLGIGSLIQWAKVDNPKKLIELLKNNANELILEAETGTEYDIAKVVYELYKHTYCCSSINHNIWYEFKKHKWVQIESAYTLNQRMSEELVDHFGILHSNLSIMGHQNNGGMRDNYYQRAVAVQKIIKKLKTSFKEKVLKECARFFFDPTFEKRLDENRTLIGFENGIYDLKMKCFREGTPDDMVSFSTGYDYVEYSEDHEYVKGVYGFFEKTQRAEDMREYILTLISSYLDGNNKNQKFIIWTGGGGNGKSKSVELIQNAFGKYAETLPVTLLTQKRGKSSEATPELAQLRGVRFVVLQEPEGHDHINVGFMKELTGGDKIKARPLFRDPFEFVPQFKLLLTCNKLPDIPSADGGTWRRIRVSPWESEFVDLDKNGKYKGQPLKENQFPKDYDLEDNLQLWKGAFMWLLINKYYPAYIKSGLFEPDKVLVHTREYEKKSDVYQEFLDEQLEITKKRKDCITMDIMFNAFKSFYRESYSNSKCPNKKDLKEYFLKNDFDFDGRYMYGMKFKSDQPNNSNLDDNEDAYD